MAPRVHKCGICEESIGKKNCIQCDVCTLWIHQSCTDVSDDDLELLSKNKSLKFICSACENRTVQDKTVDDGIRTLNRKFDEMLNKSQDDMTSMKDAFTSAVTEINSKMELFLKEVRSDVETCNKRIHQVESNTSASISALEIENHVLYRRLNRGNIVIRGLPAGLPDLVAAVVALGAFYNIPVAGHDINHVCYINRKHLILVIFNNVMIRDNIMKEYFKTRMLRRSNIIDDILNDGVVAVVADVAATGGKFADRVYLNDHFSPAASKLNAACRKLRHDNIIKRYKIFNNDKLRAELTLLNGKEVDVYDVAGCNKLRNVNDTVIG